MVEPGGRPLLLRAIPARYDAYIQLYSAGFVLTRVRPTDNRLDPLGPSSGVKQNNCVLRKSSVTTCRDSYGLFSLFPDLVKTIG